MVQALSMGKSYKYNSMQSLVHRDCHLLPKPHMGAPCSFIIDRKTKSWIHVGVCAILWEIWKYQNDVIFSNASSANFYRFFTKRFIGSTYGRISNPKTSRCIWIMDALIWWQSFGLSSTRVVDNVLTEYKMHSLILYSFSRWLIHVATLSL
jgi:hypothetical protein